jgi:hypothetical protein
LEDDFTFSNTETECFTRHRNIFFSIILFFNNSRKNVEKERNGYKILNSKLGEVFVNSTMLQTSFFHSPNGEKERQGWILSKDQYPTVDYLLGDIPHVLALSKTLDLLGFRQNSIRVNVQIPMNATLIRDLMINIYREENRKDSLHENNFKLETEYSTGFKKRLLEQKNGKFIYNPTMQQLYEDYIIRQGMELKFPKEDVWSQPIQDLRKKFVNLKLNSYEPFGLDISPILLFSNKNDPISEILIKFVKPSQSVQFREFKGKPTIAVRRSVGIVKATELLGPFIADSAISQISLVELNVIREFRNHLKLRKKIFFKYIVWNPETCPNIHLEGHRDLIEFYIKKEKFILGHIETGILGHAPLIIPGVSVVWHQKSEHRFCILGRYNPSLINLNLAHFLQNKWFEYLYYETYCPNFLPKSKLLLNLLPEGVNRFNVDPELVVTLANENFPNGWILKGVWDYNGIEHVITQKTNIVEEHKRYKSSDFDEFFNIKKNNLKGCEPVEDINEAVKKNPNFIGFKVDSLLMDSAHTFIQELHEIETEYRIECVAGHCPLDAMMPDGDHKEKKRMNDFFMKCIDNLPEILKGTPLTADPAVLKGGSFTTLETNPGGNGWFIHNDESIAKAHNAIMKKYISMYQEDSFESPLHRGMKPEEEIKYIQHMTNVWNVSLPILSSKFENYLPDRIINNEQYLSEIKRERINEVEQVLTPKMVSGEIKALAVQKGLDFISKNIQGLFNDDSSEFLHLLVHFSIRKKSIPESSNSLQEIIKLFKKDYVNLFLEKQLNQLRKFEMKMPMNYKLNEKETKDLASLIISNVEHLQDLQILDIDCDAFRSTLSRFYDILMAQDLKDWNTFMFGNFDILGVSKFNLFKEMLKQKNHMGEGLKEIKVTLSKLTESIRGMYSFERSGFRFPGFSLKSLLEIWIPSIREIYKTISDEKSIQSNETFQGAFLELSYLVSGILQVSSDNSLFGLKKKTFESEFEFLIKASNISHTMEEVYLNAEIIDSLRLFGEPLMIQKNIQENQFYFVTEQSPKGSWKIEEKVDVHSMNSGITILLNTLNHLESRSEIASLDEYKEKLNKIGLMLNKYELRSMNSNDKTVREIVKRTLEVFSLGKYFQ